MQARQRLCTASPRLRNHPSANERRPSELTDTALQNPVRTRAQTRSGSCSHIPPHAAPLLQSLHAPASTRAPTHTQACHHHCASPRAPLPNHRRATQPHLCPPANSTFRTKTATPRAPGASSPQALPPPPALPFTTPTPPPLPTQHEHATPPTGPNIPPTLNRRLEPTSAHTLTATQTPRKDSPVPPRQKPRSNRG